MKTGFTFKEHHSREFGIVAKTKSRPIFPEQKLYYHDTPLMDGEYDMSDCNSLGRTVYKSRLFEIDMQISGGGIHELERKAARIALWLTGRGILIFDDASAVQWDSRVTSDIAFSPEHGGKTAVLSVVFKANIGTATFTTVEGISLGDAITLDSDIPFNMSEYFEKQLSSGENTIEAVNIGDFYIKPRLEFSPGANNITVSYGDSKIMLEDLSTDAVIDLERCIVTNTDGDNLINKMQGNFFELPSGVSVLNVFVDGDCILKINYAPKTIYDFDFSDIDWGTVNA